MVYTVNEGRFGVKAEAVRIMQTIISVMLKESGRSWIGAGAAGGAELAAAAEPFRLRVALPVALGKALDLSASESALLGARAVSYDESLSTHTRWLRWSIELPCGGFDRLGLGAPEGQSRIARAFSEALGAALFAEFEVEGLDENKINGDWVSVSRDTSGLERLYALLEAKALGAVAQAREPSRGLGRL